MLEEERDEEMSELLKEELSEAKKDVEQYEEELKVLLLPKDPNDDKNVIVCLASLYSLYFSTIGASSFCSFIRLRKQKK